jgi:DNA-binding response OmpR family regulator
MQVLLVEDEPSIADSVVYALESEGMRCQWVSTGQAALAALGEATPDLVLLDIGLPDINGFDLFRRLRAYSKAPILFLTAAKEAMTVYNSTAILLTIELNMYSNPKTAAKSVRCFRIPQHGE